MEIQEIKTRLTLAMLLQHYELSRSDASGGATEALDANCWMPTGDRKRCLPRDYR